MLILKDPKKYCDLPIEERVYGVKQLMDFWLISDSMSSGPECIIGKHTLGSWQNFHIGCLTCGVRAIMVGNAK